MTTTVVRKTYPTLGTVNGVTSEVSLEELTLVAIENYINLGNFDKVKNVTLTVPIKADIIGTKEIFLEQYKDDFILVESNFATGDYLFGPINEKTVTLAMGEVLAGEPIYRTTTFGDLCILDEEVLQSIDDAVSLLPTTTGLFSLKHSKTKVGKQNKHTKIEIEEHTISSLLFKLQECSHKSLSYYDIYIKNGTKPSTLDTFIKKLHESEPLIDYVIDIVYAKNIKEIDDSTYVTTLTGNNAVLLLLIESMQSNIFPDKEKDQKIYVTNIREKSTTLSEFITKKELHTVKSVFSKLPNNIIKSIIRLTEHTL